MGDLIRLPTRHRDASHPPATPNALMNARIVARMSDANIERVLQRICERMDAEENREARLKISKSANERTHLIGLMRRARKALGEGER